MRLLRPPPSGIFRRSFPLHSPRYARETIAEICSLGVALARRSRVRQAPRLGESQLDESGLVKLWDRSWQRNGRIFLIICGSFIGFMEREMLGKSSPFMAAAPARFFSNPSAIVRLRSSHRAPQWYSTR